MSGTSTHRGAQTHDHKVQTLCLPTELDAIHTRLAFSVSLGQQIDLCDTSQADGTSQSGPSSLQDTEL